MTAILKSTNEGWGFLGTIGSYTDAEFAWEKAFNAIKQETDASDIGVRAFLDSRAGRHFADDVLNFLRRGARIEIAIDHAVELWQGWSITKGTERDHGIPAGLPYLTGMVWDAEIHAS
jgi:hypothetical protein